jgi:hypothetical protein
MAWNIGAWLGFMLVSGWFKAFIFWLLLARRSCTP